MHKSNIIFRFINKYFFPFQIYKKGFKFALKIFAKISDWLKYCLFDYEICKMIDQERKEKYLKNRFINNLTLMNCIKWPLKVSKRGKNKI